MLDLEHLDLDALEKGSVIPASTVEKVINERRSGKRYSRASLALQSHIERHFKKLGVTVTVIYRQDDLVILTDLEASEYNRRRFDLELKGARRAHRRGQGVDTSGFNSTDRDEHDLAVSRQAHVLVAIRKAQKSYETQEEVRTVPEV